LLQRINMNTTKIVINEFKNQLYYFASWIYLLILLTNLDNDFSSYMVDNEFDFKVLFITFLAWTIHFLVSFLYKNEKAKLILLAFILFCYFFIIMSVPETDTEVRRYYLLFYNIVFCLYCINILYFLYKLKLWMKNLR
jgi:hypothetical protein